MSSEELNEERAAEYEMTMTHMEIWFEWAQFEYAVDHMWNFYDMVK